jgi:hypothetical protein
MSNDLHNLIYATNDNTSKTTYIVPRAFFDDHINRELPPFDAGTCSLPDGVIVKTTRSTYTVLLTTDEMAELWSDADYYSDIVKMSEDNSYLGLQTSARATVKRLQAQYNSKA